MIEQNKESTRDINIKSGYYKKAHNKAKLQYCGIQFYKLSLFKFFFSFSSFIQRVQGSE